MPQVASEKLRCGRWVAEGAAVVAGARRRERLEELVESVTHDDGKAIAVKCDVTDEEQAHDLVQRAVEEFGSIDILVNNAGIMLSPRWVRASRTSGGPCSKCECDGPSTQPTLLSGT